MKTMETKNFWQGETCEYCNGKIVEKRVTLHRKIKGEYVLIENKRACADGERSTARFSCQSTNFRKTKRPDGNMPPSGLLKTLRIEAELGDTAKYAGWEALATR